MIKFMHFSMHLLVIGMEMRLCLKLQCTVVISKFLLFTLSPRRLDTFAAVMSTHSFLLASCSPPATATFHTTAQYTSQSRTLRVLTQCRNPLVRTRTNYAALTETNNIQSALLCVFRA